MSTHRFAPSPTGPLHVGSLVAAVASYAHARAMSANWLVRIEDVDAPRCRAAHAQDILRTLIQFGMTWDGEVRYQSTRATEYGKALMALRGRQKAFFCTCSRREIADSSLLGVDGPVYPGTCRRRSEAAIITNGAWRLNVHEAGVIRFDDAVQGPQRQDLTRDVGDFVLQRRDGLFAYQLAVVVDDAEQGVTHVVRGADLLDSTARQIYLQRALGVAMPEYAHVPVVTDAAGQKLSKQTLAPAIRAAEAMDELRRAWAFLGQSPLTLGAAAAPSDFWQLAIPAWRLEQVPKVRARPI